MMCSMKGEPKEHQSWMLVEMTSRGVRLISESAFEDFKFSIVMNSIDLSSLLRVLVFPPLHFVDIPTGVHFPSGVFAIDGGAPPSGVCIHHST